MSNPARLGLWCIKCGILYRKKGWFATARERSANHSAPRHLHVFLGFLEKKHVNPIRKNEILRQTKSFSSFFGLAQLIFARRRYLIWSGMGLVQGGARQVISVYNFYIYLPGLPQTHLARVINPFSWHKSVINPTKSPCFLLKKPSIFGAPGFLVSRQESPLNPWRTSRKWCKDSADTTKSWTTPGRFDKKGCQLSREDLIHC